MQTAKAAGSCEIAPNRDPALTKGILLDLLVNRVLGRVTFRANMTPHVQRILQQYQSDDPIPRWGHGWARFHT
jgi:hypothetical protein